uniref:ELP1 first N-terminal beta-propeller domain-containing protein n=1 Tax=Romanomermis culicivorax TaxID=13658 RepID=A0A915JBK0_ROMCU
MHIGEQGDANSTQDIIVDLPCSSQGDYIIHVEYIIEQQLVVFFTRKGLLGTYDHFSRKVDFLSSVENEIETVAFSPDFDLVAVVTLKKDLFLLNRDYEIVSEISACPVGRGQGW